MKADQAPKLTVAEYISQEQESGVKYEYHNGNIYAELRTGLGNKNSNCKPLASEAKLFIKSKNKYVYPDSMVICGN
ncbi:MAG: hypothetical protein AB8E82_08860 [Aureispira sp.]